MKLLFKQRFFSWFDSYDIYDEAGNPVFTVKGQLAWGHLLQIYDAMGNNIGTVKERIFTFLPKFELYMQGNYMGEIQKEFTFFKPVYNINVSGWRVEGDFLGWEYQALDGAGQLAMSASKQLFNWTDTYVIDVPNPANALLALMVVLAIDAANCSSND
ncbi:MAG: LURP-one-related/scramblase family protein [Oscillospiraceae bacterium]